MMWKKSVHISHIPGQLKWVFNRAESEEYEKKGTEYLNQASYYKVFFFFFTFPMFSYTTTKKSLKKIAASF